jgi:hypothetical protein
MPRRETRRTKDEKPRNSGVVQPPYLHFIVVLEGNWFKREREGGKAEGKERKRESYGEVSLERKGMKA